VYDYNLNIFSRRIFVKLVVAVFMVLTFFGEVVLADSCGEIKGGIVTVRDSLIKMLNDKKLRTPEQKKLVKDTSDRVTMLIDQMTYPAEKKTDYEKIKSEWAMFKKIREEQVVPYIEAGRDEEAKKLAQGEQKVRLMNVMKWCGELRK